MNNGLKFYPAHPSGEETHRIKVTIPADKISGKGSRNFRFTNGQITLVGEKT